MSKYAKTYLACFRCKGKGTEEEHLEGEDLIPERPCPYCGGDGIKTISLMIDVTEIMDKLNDVLDKCNDIFEKVNV